MRLSESVAKLPPMQPRHHSPGAQVRTRFSAHPQWLLSGPIFALSRSCPFAPIAARRDLLLLGSSHGLQPRLGGGEHSHALLPFKRAPTALAAQGSLFLGAPNSLSYDPPVRLPPYRSLHISSFFKSLLHARSSNSVVTLFPSFLQWVSTSSRCQPRPSFSFSLSRSA